MLRLHIGNKNYSSWSMRPWVLLRQSGIAFEEVMVRFDSFDPNSNFKTALGTLHAAGKVPVLVDDALVIWDTLAIAEYLAEKFPDHALWPAQPSARALARSACAEMHAGFGALRTHCPMNIEATLAEQGALIWRDQTGVRADLERLVALWGDLLERFGGPLLFGTFSIADAYFAPVCMRLKTYALPVPATITTWVDKVVALAGVQAWIRDAKAEDDFLPFEEPYRLVGSNPVKR